MKLEFLIARGPRVALMCVLPALIFVRFLLGTDVEKTVLEISLVAAVEILLMLPLPGEAVSLSYFSILPLLPAFALCVFLRPPVMVCLSVMASFMVAYLCFRTVWAHFGLDVVEMPSSVWLEVGSTARLLLTVLLFFFEGLMVALPSHLRWGWVSPVLLSLLFGMVLYQTMTGRCLFLPSARVKDVEARLASLAFSEDGFRTEEDEYGKMLALFSRIEFAMEQGRPFLKPDYSLQDLTNAVYTNRAYISKTINVMTGKNFRQFVNGYRVRYAVSLLEDNPRLKVGELADMSGFNSSTTFNMAFKANMGETPGEFSIRLRSGLPAPLSSRAAEAQVCAPRYAVQDE